LLNECAWWDSIGLMSSTKSPERAINLGVGLRQATGSESGAAGTRSRMVCTSIIIVSGHVFVFRGQIIIGNQQQTQTTNCFGSRKTESQLLPLLTTEKKGRF
jgi:hypothetical protein